MIYTYRGTEYDIAAPEDVLLAIIEAETAGTQEERDDAQSIVDAFDAETAALLPLIHEWNQR